MTAPLLATTRRKTTNWLLVYGSLIVSAEFVLTLVNPPAGVLIEATLLVVIVSHHAFAGPPRDPLLPVLALIPMLRLLSLAMPIPQTAPLLTYVLVGGPALVGALLTARAVGLSPGELGLGRPTNALRAIAVAATGLPIGLVARTIGGVSPMVVGDASPILVTAVAAIFVVFFEEFMFRGLLPRVATSRSDLLGIGGPAVLYAALYVGSGSPSAVLFMGATGALFGFLVARFGSLWIVIGAHLLMRLLIQV